MPKKTKHYQTGGMYGNGKVEVTTLCGLMFDHWDRDEHFAGGIGWKDEVTCDGCIEKLPHLSACCGVDITNGFCGKCKEHA